MEKSRVPRVAFTLTEAAEAAGVSRPVMTEWANRADFPAIKAGRKWVIPCDLFKQWLEDHAKQRHELNAAGA